MSNPPIEELKFYTKKMQSVKLIGGCIVFILMGLFLFEIPNIAVKIIGLLTFLFGVLGVGVMSITLFQKDPVIVFNIEGIKQRVLFGDDIFITWKTIHSFQYITVQKQTFLQITTIDQGSRELPASSVGLTPDIMYEIILRYLEIGQIELPYLSSGYKPGANPNGFETQEEAMEWLLKDKSNYRL